MAEQTQQVLRVGVIGAGAMGADHVSTLTSSVPVARVSAVFDMDVQRAAAVAGPAGADVAESGLALIARDDVDAVIVASPDFTHADLVRECLRVGKPVLCEKPLAPTAAEAREVLDAEVAGGRQLVQVGFMRRFDPGFVELKRLVSAGALGEVRIVHAVHRNASNPISTDDATLISGSMIHEIDTIAWLLEDPIVGIRVESPVSQGFRDPQLATMWTASGVMVTAEVFVNASYGYDVRCEVVGSAGTAALAPRSDVSLRAGGNDAVAVRDDFVAHFADAYRNELNAWANAARRGEIAGPSAWDGYVANVVAEAGVASLSSGVREHVTVTARPALNERR
jgi:myo-inositol 2-dehydrogenase/D-chiro-inositol 1-dehydrogenase